MKTILQRKWHPPVLSIYYQWDIMLITLHKSISIIHTTTLWDRCYGYSRFQGKEIDLQRLTDFKIAQLGVGWAKIWTQHCVQSLYFWSLHSKSSPHPNFGRSKILHRKIYDRFIKIWKARKSYIQFPPKPRYLLLQSECTMVTHSISSNGERRLTLCFWQCIFILYPRPLIPQPAEWQWM